MVAVVAECNLAGVSTRRVEGLVATLGIQSLSKSQVSELAKTLDSEVAAFRARADAAGVTLAWHATDEVHELDVDPVRIGEVLANLLANAVRHTPRGGSVTALVEPAPAGVSFTVSDTGTGIDAADLPYVFDRFVKSADSGGVGLGLAIARSLVQAHGGTITADSQPGRGTTMRFTLPLAAARP